MKFFQKKNISFLQDKLTDELHRLTNLQTIFCLRNILKFRDTRFQKTINFSMHILDTFNKRFNSPYPIKDLFSGKIISLLNYTIEYQKKCFI